MQKTRLCFLGCGTVALKGYKLLWSRCSAELGRFASYCALVDRPDAVVVVQEKDYRAGRDSMQSEYHSYRDPSLDSQLHKLNFIDNREIFGGIWLDETPGHSLGQSTMVADPAAFHMDPVAAYRPIARVEELPAKHDAGAFFDHASDNSLVCKAWRWY
ncbi:MAG: hypothetical protein LLG45_10495 [Actinomycetia bacterium]|nr:hypothetical protein [Actinomycetes bacterium]